MMRKIVILILALTIVGLTGCSKSNDGNTKPNKGSEAKAEKKGSQNISIASAGSGGTWYWVGAAMAEVINKNCTGVKATNEQTSGATEDIRLVDGGKAEIGMSTADVIVFAYNGDKDLGFQKKYDNLRALMAGHNNLAVFLTMPDRGIKTLQDLKGSGARVSLGPKGTSSEPHMLAVLKAHGVDPQKDIKLLYLSFNEQIEGLKNGTLDVARIGGGIPTASIVDLTTTHKVVFINPDKSILEKQNTENQYWGMAKIPAGTYKGQTEDYWAPTERTLAFVRQDMPEDMAYNITKAWIEHVDEMTKVHPSGAEWNMENAQKEVKIPFHPGAIKYYKEKGVWKGQ